jgi:hypothetical protein
MLTISRAIEEIARPNPTALRPSLFHPGKEVIPVGR